MVRQLLLLAVLATAAAQPRAIQSVLPQLEYSRACTSTIELRNLSRRTVKLLVEAHRASGALVALRGLEGVDADLSPLQTLTLKLAVENESGWLKVREFVPADGSPVVAAQGVTDCVEGDQMRSVIREVAFPTASPWFSGDVSALPGGEISLINTSEFAVTATGCYSSGSLFSNPGERAGVSLRPVCSNSFHVQVPPFGARRFPVARDTSSHFSIKTQGSAIVLQMLRPVEAAVRLFKVDSSIQFGNEVPACHSKVVMSCLGKVEMSY